MLTKITTAFRDLRIGTRISLGYLFTTAATVVVGWWGIHSMTQLNEVTENANGVLLPSVRHLGALRAGLLSIQRTDRTLIMAARSKDVAIQKRASGNQAAAWVLVDKSRQAYESLPLTEKEKTLWTELTPRLAELRRDHEATKAALSTGDDVKAEQVCLAAMPNVTRVNALLDGLMDIQEEIGRQEWDHAKGIYAAARSIMFTVIGGAVLLAVVLGLVIARGVVRPLHRTVTALQAVARGDLSVQADVTSRDEAGQMAAALNTTVRGIKTGLQVEKVDWEEIGRQREMNADFRGQIAAIGRAQAVVEFSLDGTVTHANDNFLAVMGYTLSEVVGRHHRAFMDPTAAGGAEYREFWAKLNRGEYLAGEFRRVAKGGREVWLQASYNPIFDASGKLYKVVKYASDISANKDLERRVKEDAAELRQKVDAIQVTVAALAAGDFTQHVPNLGDDAVGQMASALNSSIDTVRTALEGVREVSEQLADASAQLAAGSEEISSGAQEQASSLEETASTLEEITATVRQNADAAQQARQLASGSRDVAERGGQVVGNAVGAMGEINQSSKKIADIITTIDEIAFQTNLLALNAAVEAARAGEQGRGFAVVAAEVRNLAQRSATAAKEIKGLIQDSVRKVEAGTELVNRSGSTLDEIVTSVKRVTDIVTEIAAASREQSTGIDQVNKAVTQMDAVTQRNAGQTEEMSATAQALTDQAGQLRELVARFKLSDGSGLAPASRGAIPGRKAAMSAGRPRAVVARAAGGRHGLDALGDDGGYTEF